MADLAVLGGTPVRTTAFPRWPIRSERVADAVREVALGEVWGDANGPRKTAFEERFARFQGAAHGLAVSNGTVSLEIALRALGIGSGDEVIVPAYTFLATASSVLTVNALPVFVDVRPDTANLDPAAAEAAISPRTKAIIAVHLGGQSADLTALQGICERHSLALIEDAAQAHGAEWQGHRVGSIGSFGSFSFQASKNLTAGEGGFLTTNDAELADLAWSYHHCGRPRVGKWYEHVVLGGNHRMTEFQAAVLDVQLDDLPDQLVRREASAARIDQALQGIDGIEPLGRDSRCTRHAYHLYQMSFHSSEFAGVSRVRFVEALNAEGIPASAGYGVPLDRQPLFAERHFDLTATGYDEGRAATRFGSLELPVTQRLCDESVWIPQSVLLAEEPDIDDVVTAIERVREHAELLGAGNVERPNV